MVDFSPHVCCTCDHEPKQKDECMCGCGYLNGGIQVAAAQCLLILGSFFSLAALGDCAFVHVDENLRFPIGVDKTSNTFGFVTFEDSFGGRCYWYDDDGPSPRDQIEQYWDFLGSDFQLSRIFAGIAACGGWLQFFYSVTLCCSSQVRSIRYFLFFLVSIVLTIFQGLSLVIFNGDFCQEHDCVFGRAAGFACAACGCYFVAGIMYCIMADYPGARLIDSPTVEEGEKDVVVDEEQQPIEMPTKGILGLEPQEQAPFEDEIVFEEIDDQSAADTMDKMGEEQDAESDSTPIARGNEVPVEQEVEDDNKAPVEEEVEEEEVEEEIEEEIEEEVIEEEEEIIEEIVEDDKSPKTAEDVLAFDDSSQDHIFKD